MLKNLPAFFYSLYSHLKNNFLAILLVTISIIVATTNYAPDVWLTGWDTLHPEFDFPLHLYRSFFGVWREDQGLGTLAAHSHMSELPRILVLWLFNLVLPLHSVKFVYVLSSLILGPLGIYFFINSLFKRTSPSTQAAAFIGSLWYLMNLGTVQHFYIVFEMFAVQYAALGWLFWLAYLYQQNGSRKIAIGFFIVSFLTSPMAYASLLWWTFAFSLSLFLSLMWLQKPTRVFFFRGIAIGVIILASNSYWLLPNLYFLSSDYSKYISNSTINRLFSPEAFWHNQAYGNLFDLVLLKNFLFNWQEYNDGSFTPLLQTWMIHLQNPLVRFITTMFSLIGLAGIGLSFNKEYKSFRAVFPLFLVSVFMLINQNTPFTFIFEFLRDHLDVFKEGLRFPFTKFSMIYMLGISVYIAVFFHHFFTFTEKFKNFAQNQQLIISLTISLVILAQSYFFLPAFSGHLINSQMKNEIPTAYFELFKWSKNIPSQSRIALLPLETQAGWHYLDWNYEGPGFWWFGLKQPFLTRDFDRWSPYNETFYKELQYALKSEDSQAFIQVLNKYQVNYLLIDHSLISPGTNKATVSSDQVQKLITRTGMPQIWSANFLSVYQVNAAAPFLQIPATYSYVDTNTTYTKDDIVYQEQENYVEYPQNAVIYPFVSLMSERNAQLEIKNDNLIFEQALSTPENSSYRLSVPTFLGGSKYQTAVTVSYSNRQLNFYFPVTTISVDDQTINLPQISNFTISLVKDYAQPILEIADQQLLLSDEDAVQTVIEATVGEPISLRIFDSKNVILTGQRQTISTENIENVRSEYKIWHSFSAIDSLSVSQPKSIKIITEALSKNVDFITGEVNNCRSDLTGTVKKELTNRGALYKADGRATACEGEFVPGISTYPYVLEIQNNNISGRSLKFYLTHFFDNQSVLEDLIPEGSYNEKYVILPQTNSGSYYLSWDTRSLGQVSINELEHIRFYPLPAIEIAQVKLIPTEEHKQTNTIDKLVSLSKQGTYLYGTSVKAKGKPGLITLSQSYDQGWLAFARPAQRWLPGGYRPLPHYRYNGWANAWEVPEGEWRVTIIYWPQLLSFAGYGLLVGGFAYLTWQVLQEKRQLNGLKTQRLKKAVIQKLHSN